MRRLKDGILVPEGFKENAASVVANRLYSSYSDYCNDVDKVVNPDLFFESEYILSNHPTKHKWKNLIYIFYKQKTDFQRVYLMLDGKVE